MKYASGLVIVTMISVIAADAASGQPPASRQLPPLTQPLGDALLRWPLSPSDKVYESIDGRRLHRVVTDLTAIARRYRDDGHPQFWGRIIGTSADEESAAYLIDRFTQIGLADVRRQVFDLPPQWMAASWSITATGAGQTITLVSAQPTYGTRALPPEGLAVEPIWVGTGTEADYLGRDVRGKAVFITRSTQTNPRLAEERGAAALILVNALPGNIRTQIYSIGTSVPTFTMGRDDGSAVRDLIVNRGSRTAQLLIRLDTRLISGLKTSTVWATLPGATNETIYVLGHRDGWFEGATDNASGVATMVGLAEHFARLPRAQRRRTMVFIGSAGHHNSMEITGHATNPSNVSGTWLVENRDTLFANAALFINCEHTATVSTFVQLGREASRIRRINTPTGLQWYAGGSSRPELQNLAVRAFKDFGVATYVEPESTPPNGEAAGVWPYVPVLQVSDYNLYFHTDADTAETVPWTGLEAVTRAYAKIIDGVNRLPLKDLIPINRAK